MWRPAADRTVEAAAAYEWGRETEAEVSCPAAGDGTEGAAVHQHM